MSGRTRGVMIGMGGLMAGGFAAGLVDWSPLPKAAFVAAVCVVVALAIWLVLRPKAGA